MTEVNAKEAPEARETRRRGHLPPVNVRITKFGDGKVSTGRHIAEQGDEMFDAGAIVSLPRDVAEELEVRGLAEIQPEPEPESKPEDKKPDAAKK